MKTLLCLARGILPLGLCLASILPVKAADLAPQNEPDSQVKAAPSGLLLNPAPALSAWQIIYTYPTDKDVVGGTPEVPVPQDPPVIGNSFPTTPARRVTLTRNKSAWQAHTVTVDGRTVDQWSDGTDEIGQCSGMYSPIVVTGDASGNLIHYDRSDFPGFEWISASNYTGIQSINSIPCMVFSNNGLMAWISVEGRLPVRLQSPTEKRDYQQLPPPAGPIVFPAAAQNILKALASDRAWKARPVPRGG